MVLDPYFAMKCALGENPKKGYETTRMGIAATLRNFLFQAKAYAEDPNHKFDMKLEPMVPVIQGEKALKIHCHEGIDIVTAVRICDEFHLKFTLDHVTCGTDVLDFLRKRPEIPLLLGPSLGHRSKVELHGKGFENVVKLAEGRDVCLITDAPVIPLQYLPICAGLAISKGMPYERALEAVTINPALSHHLKILRENGLITSRRAGKEMYYKAANTEEVRLLHHMIELLIDITCPEHEGERQ